MKSLRGSIAFNKKMSNVDWSNSFILSNCCSLSSKRSQKRNEFLQCLRSKINAKIKPLIDGSRSSVDLSKKLLARVLLAQIFNWFAIYHTYWFGWDLILELENANQFYFTDVIRTAKSRIRYSAGVRNWSPDDWNYIAVSLSSASLDNVWRF